MDIAPITELTAVARIGVSLLLGGVIGWERNKHKHPAGSRTFMLICMAATLATIASIYICQTNPDLKNGDPGRIAAQILTGIGFLGAGLIIKTQDGVSGLTTAACIFMAAVIGVAVGVGLLLIASIVTLVSVIILWSPYMFRDHFDDSDRQ